MRLFSKFEWGVFGFEFGSLGIAFTVDLVYSLPTTMMAKCSREPVSSDTSYDPRWGKD